MEKPVKVPMKVPTKEPMKEPMKENQRMPYICKLIYEAYRVPVMWLDEEDHPDLTLPPAVAGRPAVQEAVSLLAEIMDHARRSRSGVGAAAGMAAETATDITAGMTAGMVAGTATDIAAQSAEGTTAGMATGSVAGTATGMAAGVATGTPAGTSTGLEADIVAETATGTAKVADTDAPASVGTAPVTPALPVLYTTGYLENFIILQVAEADLSCGAIVIGPVLSAPITGDNAASLMRDHSIPPGQQEDWLQYYSSLPVLNRMRWYHAALLLYTLVTGQQLSITELLLTASTPAGPAPSPGDSPDLDLSYRRETTWLHHDPMLEREMFRHITNGDKAGLLRTQASFAEENYGRLSKQSQLRSKKNLAVSSITLATRAAIEGGLFWEIAYTLSDFHIQHIEELRDIPAVDRAMVAALCDFADQVLGSRSSKLTRISALCQNFIYNHLYEELPLSRLAEFTGLNASYLSQLFKKETGTAISDYIQQERIEESKRLIGLPGITLSDIASRLHFNDQSYFTKVFKKYTGLTPGQYKQHPEQFPRFR
ncbi:AraC family transcriptional regulator [Paenibacillus tritici]|uniref:AraC family transcriptional regulator n=1 Tax=Paenibacillus tritici TaxID=1873425 RepID=UPI001BA7D6C5|nr:AraC family transcriptional regulator [Paenibacillus tritici]QUL56407.1 AraC family transcriptional regulator [Paenibacillus tritici]